MARVRAAHALGVALAARRIDEPLTRVLQAPAYPLFDRISRVFSTLGEPLLTAALAGCIVLVLLVHPGVPVSLLHPPRTTAVGCCRTPTPAAT